ncbi:hypothetical protein DL93DRAFT_449029 [Clavulina sp. PMI_390]|nr:hypothetical protein DL93DRAFT_449029 [Clavulina sp. PMI_390]
MVFAWAFLPELLVEIMSYLSTPDLKSCALVKRSWNQEATRLLWHSIKLEVGIYGPAIEFIQAMHRFSDFFNALSREVWRAPYVRRLTIKMMVLLDDEVILRSFATPQKFFTVSWKKIAHALSLMHQLQHLELKGSFPYSHRFVSAVCRALSSAPIHTIHSCLEFTHVLGEYASWASSITSLIISSAVDYQDVPHFPCLRFIASDQINMITRFILSSPIELFCFFGVTTTETDLTMLANAVRVQASGKSTLRSIQVAQFINEKILLQRFLSSLECPTLERVHLVLGAMEWSEPFNMADYAVACLEATSSSISHSLPTLRSLRFDIFNHRRDVVPSKRVHLKDTSSHLVTEAGFRLSTWLHQRNHPPVGGYFT